MNPLRLACVLVVAVSLPACEPLSLAALSAGASAGVHHQMAGNSYRTFSTSLPRVRSAVQVALERMGIAVSVREKVEGGELILARTAQREIEIELESLTPRATRMRTTARNGFFLLDPATSSEIIQQTERVLAPGGRTTKAVARGADAL